MMWKTATGELITERMINIKFQLWELTEAITINRSRCVHMHLTMT